MATKTLKVKQIAFDSNDHLHALADDGSVWVLDKNDVWSELPAIDVEEDDGEEDVS